MKITVRNDEAASLLPSEVKVRQQASEWARLRNKQWQEFHQCCEQLPSIEDVARRSPLMFALAAVWPEVRGGE